MPNDYDTLYFCDYNLRYDAINVWEWPGGSGRAGNVSFHTGLSGMIFNSIPWISSGTVNGQRWIYGALVVPTSAGPYYAFGWVGRNYLNISVCGTSTFSSSNMVLAGTHYGDPFASQPSEVSAVFRGQTWVWGVDPYTTHRAGWVGSQWLRRTGCDSSGCFYTITASNIREWIEVGGAPGA